MNKTLKISAVVLASLIMVVGCGKNEPAPQVVKAAECTFPGSEKAAPNWICDAPIEGVELSAVGIAKKSAAGYSFMKQMATADARVQLAQTFKSHVSNMIKQYASVTGSADSETVDQVNTSVSKLITSEKLIGSRNFRSKIGPDGSLYVLVGLDSAKVTAAAEQSINSSMRNDKALWQEFKAKKAQDDLAAEIARFKK